MRYHVLHPTTGDWAEAQEVARLLAELVRVRGQVATLREEKADALRYVKFAEEGLDPTDPVDPIYVDDVLAAIRQARAALAYTAACAEQARRTLRNEAVDQGVSPRIDCLIIIDPTIREGHDADGREVKC